MSERRTSPPKKPNTDAPILILAGLALIAVLAGAGWLALRAFNAAIGPRPAAASPTSEVMLYRTSEPAAQANTPSAAPFTPTLTQAVETRTPAGGSPTAPVQPTFAPTQPPSATITARPSATSTRAGPRPTDTRWPTPTSPPTNTLPPTLTPTVTRTLTHTPRPSATPTLTLTPRPTATRTLTRTATPTRTYTPTATATRTPRPSLTPTPMGALDYFLADTPALCVSYFDEQGGSLRFVCRDRGMKWLPVAVIDNEGVVGEYSSLNFDQNSAPWITYYDRTNGDLKLATIKRSGWITAVVDASGDAGQRSSLDIDSRGEPVVAYYEASRQMVRLARRDENGWKYQDLETVGEIRDDFRVSLGLDRHDTAYVAFRNYAEAKLKMVKISADGTIKSYVVDDTRGAGGYSTLAIFADGSPAVAYYNGATSKKILVFAQFDGDAFRFESPDAKRDVGVFATMIIDPNNNPAICYLDEGLDDLRFSRRAGGRWQVPESVANWGSTGFYASLDMDAAGRVSVAYYDYTRKKLGVSTKMDNAWLMPQDPDPATMVGKFPSLRYLP